ncbi:alanine racemase [Nannocystis sp. RBIL2]|uniref:alanine racemase n=1 Tax=Nannocystis sp. RBIL2 TaxID=2996788 RepID=UPI002270178C|nr:alanine racemase [Nannocystis sp. RBIL2]MCY1063426.1 alanine racemase [Nannocystis sp. RBIL2]
MPRSPTPRANFGSVHYSGPERRVADRRQAPIIEVRPTYAYVDAGAMVHNLRTVQAAVGPRCRVLAVVKADGYGHGAIEAARTFVDAGAWGCAVSLVEEGVELRQAELRAPVLVLGGVHPGSEDVIVHRSLTPVVWAREHLQLLSAAVRRSGAPPLPIHLKIDTGMSRLGALPGQLPEFLDWLEGEDGQYLRLEGVMTHFACADEPDDVTSPRQLESFRDSLAVLASRGFHPPIRHVCNSAGLVRLPHAHFDMVRPGVAIYGAASSREVELPGLKMAMSVHSRILGIRELPAGARVSYGHRMELNRPSRLGIVPVGYADGYPRRMSGQAQALVRGHRCRVVGNITMDVSMIDVTDLPDAREGERVTLLGPQGRDRIDAYELARWADVIPYEILCGISKRVPRRG